MRDKLTVGVVAGRLGMRSSAVRFYERQGLVVSERLPNGYRVYDREAMAVLGFIHRAKALGFSLEEVREILTLSKQGTKPCACVTQMIARNLAVIDQRIAQLTDLRRQLRALTEAPIRDRATRVICPIIETDV